MVILLDAQQTGANANAHAQEVFPHQAEHPIVLELKTKSNVNLMFMLKHGVWQSMKVTFKNPSRMAKYVAALSAIVTGTARFAKASLMQSSNSSTSFRRS